MPKIRLTKKIVEAIAPEAKDVIVWDSDLPGFGLKVTPAGKRVYFCYFRSLAGQQRRPTIGPHGVLTCDEARGIAKDMLAEVRKGGDPSLARQEKRQAPTFAEFAERYLADHARLKKKPLSVEADERNLRNHILPQLGGKKLSDINRADIARFHQSLREKPGAGNRCLMLLSKMFNLAELWGFRPDYTNPCRHIEKYGERKIKRFLMGDEYARLGAILGETAKTQPAVTAAILLLIYTGCRRDEILTLRWDYVDFDRKCLNLPDSKTGEKSVHLNEAALEVLQSIAPVEGNPWVIVGSIRGAHLVNIEKPWRAIRERAGLPDVRLHDLRHSFVSIGAAMGLGLPILGTLVGHKDVSTTQGYAHLDDNPVKAANERIGQEITKVMRKPK